MNNDPSPGNAPRQTFPPFSSDQVAAVRTAVAAGGPLQCPICNRDLDVHPFDMMGVNETVFELRCEPCRHLLIVRSLPDSLR